MGDDDFSADQVTGASPPPPLPVPRHPHLKIILRALEYLLDPDTGFEEAPAHLAAVRSVIAEYPEIVEGL